MAGGEYAAPVDKHLRQDRGQFTTCRWVGDGEFRAIVRCRAGHQGDAGSINLLRVLPRFRLSRRGRLCATRAEERAGQAEKKQTFHSLDIVACRSS